MGHRSYFVLAGCLGLVSSGCGSLDANGDVAVYPGVYTSVEEWVEYSDVIMVGEIGRVVGTYTDPTETPPSGVPSDDFAFPTEQWLPYTIYEVAVEDILKDDDGRIVGPSVLVGVMGVYPQPGPGVYHPLPGPGDRRLFFLGWFPDRPEMALEPPDWGMLNIEGDVVTWPDGEASPVSLAEGYAPDEFVEFVRRVASWSAESAADGWTPQAIDDAEEAFDRALELVPEGLDPSDAVVRRLNRFDAASWAHFVTPAAGVAGELAKPAWVVGLIADDLTDCDVAPFLDNGCEGTGIFGLYVTLNANNGLPIELGVLSEDTWESLESLSDNATVTIVAQTPALLPQYTGTPGPTAFHGAPVIMTSTPTATP